jgi:PhoPQ-activated pathogenicity-related protein
MMIHRRMRALSLLFILFAAALAPAKADLKSYLKRPEPAFKWESLGKKTADGVTIYDLHLVSQTWHGIVWEHRLQLFRPDRLKYPRFCALLNTGGNGGPDEEVIGSLLAKTTGANFAILYNIPKQPLFGGKSEDALVVYTWEQYLKTGDDTWPLHFPMAKAVLKAMDALQQFSKKSGMTPLDQYLITGASKRGWTTWLAGASQDPRIKAIAPMVIDTLNLAAQIPHQLAAYGKPSEQIDDYSSHGMLKALETPAGKKLIQLEDPYSYRRILTLPKLLILGTNDRYWAQDALNLYWDGLKGPKWVMYDPNSGHGLEDHIRVFNTLGAFIVMVASGKSWPKMKWAYQKTGKDATLTLSSVPPPAEARLFRVHAPTQDFRDSKWTSEPMKKTAHGFVGRLEKPAKGYAAMFGEAAYHLNGFDFTLSTQISIVGTKKK